MHLPTEEARQGKEQRMTNIWKLAIGAGALIALAAATVGFVGAQTNGDGSGPLGSFVSKLAANLGISEDELNSAIDETQLQMIDEALADGKIDEDQAAAARERVESGEGGIFGPIIGHKLRMHRGAFIVGMHALDEYVDAAGISKAELVEAWQGEGTLGDVLTGLGVDVDAVTAQIVADVEARLTEMGAEQERIDEAVANTSEKLAEALASEDPPERPFGHGHHFPGGAMDEETADTAAAVSPTF
jgi:hypothetical protein